MKDNYLKTISKSDVYDVYDVLVKGKHPYYDYITKNKMLDKIFSCYQDYHNILSICTLKELKYLKKLIAGNCLKVSNLNEDEVFARTALVQKLLIKIDNDNVVMMDGLEEPIKKAIDNINIKSIVKKERVLIPLLGFIKVMGIERLDNIIFIVKNIYHLDEELDDYLKNSLLFHYYCFMTFEKEYEYIAIYRPYSYFYDELLDFYKNKDFGFKRFDEGELTNIFYYGYDKDNQEISKIMKKVKSPNLRQQLNIHVLFGVQNDAIKGILDYYLTDAEITTLFNKMPSSKYKGVSKEEYAKELLKGQKIENELKGNYLKQSNSSCLSKEDTELFYKTFFAVLDYTNTYYNIKKLKIYGKTNLDPQELYDIVEKFYDNKEFLIAEFLKTNPYHFNKEELQIVKNYGKSLRTMFMIVKYESDYTWVMAEEQVYMIKGLNCPIDEVVSNNLLPYPMITTLFNFKDYIVYDGMICGYDGIEISSAMKHNIIGEACGLEKVYHL